MRKCIGTEADGVLTVGFRLDILFINAAVDPFRCRTASMRPLSTRGAETGRGPGIHIFTAIHHGDRSEIVPARARKARGRAREDDR
jgi:hypothetical protein